jgi:hypothetical protein
MRENFYSYLTRDKLGELVQYLGFVGFGLLFIFLISKKTKSKDGLQKITGYFEKISTDLFSGSRSRPVIFIHLTEYKSKFQISYGGYDKKLFKQQVRPGDIITINIDKDDIGLLNVDNEKVRGFSLTVNGKVFLNETKSLDWLSTTNIMSLTTGIILLTIFGLYTGTQYRQWKRV